MWSIKWLTGFEQSLNSVLYIDKNLADHDLMQAIARVNRVHEAKQFGLLIDYRGVLAPLDTTQRHYRKLDDQQAGYELADLANMLQAIASQYLRLPDLLHHLFALFGLPEGE